MLYKYHVHVIVYANKDYYYYYYKFISGVDTKKWYSYFVTQEAWQLSYADMRSPINDLASVVSSKVRLFADDCLIYRHIKNIQDQITLLNTYICLLTGVTHGVCVCCIF